MSVQIYGLDGFEQFKIKDCASFLGKQLSIAASVGSGDKGRMIQLVSDVDNDDLEDALNLFNQYIGMAKFIYEDQKLNQKQKEGGQGRKDHQGARDKKFKMMG